MPLITELTAGANAIADIRNSANIIHQLAGSNWDAIYTTKPVTIMEPFMVQVPVMEEVEGGPPRMKIPPEFTEEPSERPVTRHVVDIEAIQSRFNEMESVLPGGGLLTCEALGILGAAANYIHALDEGTNTPEMDTAFQAIFDAAIAFREVAKVSHPVEWVKLTPPVQLVPSPTGIQVSELPPPDPEV